VVVDHPESVDTNINPRTNAQENVNKRISRNLDVAEIHVDTDSHLAVFPLVPEFVNIDSRAVKSV